MKTTKKEVYHDKIKYYHVNYNFMFFSNPISESSKYRTSYFVKTTNPEHFYTAKELKTRMIIFCGIKNEDFIKIS